MKKNYILIILSFIGFTANAQDLNLQWAKGMGASGSDFGRSIAVDAAGNVYTTGPFQGTVDFDPSANIYNLTSAGHNDIFVSKFDSSGTFVWAKRMGGTDYDVSYSIAVDMYSNVYVTGNFQGTADFDPGSNVFNLISAGGDDIFVTKLDTSGNLVWAKSIGSTGTDDSKSITLDAAGNAYITGYFQGTCDFDPGSNVYNLTSIGFANDIFVSKLDASGDFVWAKSMGGSDFEEGYFIAVDGNGNVYTTGYFNGTADFDPGTPVYNLTSAGSMDIFISKLTTAGAFVWAKRMGGTSPDLGLALTADAAGNVYTTGVFIGIADFDPGANSYNLAAAGPTGNENIFISKLDASGSFVWAKSVKGTGGDESNSIAVDAIGNIYTTGMIQDTADFDPGTGVFNLIAPLIAPNIFISKLDASGTFVWAKELGNVSDPSSDNVGTSIAVDIAGNIYTTGEFSDTADFDPGASVYNLTSIGDRDIFVAKFCQTPTLLTSIIGNASICSGSSNTYSISPVNGATSYTWALPGGWTGTSTTNSILVVADATSGNVAVTANNSCGSSSPKILAVIVNTIPLTPASINGTAIICQSSSNTYNVTAVSGATSYTWTLPSGWTGTSTTNTISSIASATSGNITVTANNTCGASAAQMASISVNPLPNVTVNSPTICAGVTANLMAGGASTYTWSSGATSTGVNTADASPVSTISYTVTGTSNGCINTAVSAVTVKPLPIVNIPSNIVACNGAIVPAATFTSVPAGATFIWTNSNTTIGLVASGNGNQSSFSATNSGASQIAGTIAVTPTLSGCSGNVSSYSITVNPTPSTPTISDVALTLTSNSLIDNQWYLNGTIISGAIGQTYTAISNGTYTVKVTTSGCSSASSVPIVITNVGIDEELNPYMFNIYPNPNDGSFNVTFNTSDKIDYGIELYNTLGQIIFSDELTDFTGTYSEKLNVTEYGKGIYTIRLINPKNEIARKFIVY
jgi:hypothetical protein